jgi:hypothetical protein
MQNKLIQNAECRGRIQNAEFRIQNWGCVKAKRLQHVALFFAQRLGTNSVHSKNPVNHVQDKNSELRMRRS